MEGLRFFISGPFIGKRKCSARNAYDEALAVRRKLAEKNPDAFQPDVATTLNNLGYLHATEHRPAEARLAYEEALTLFRRFNARNPSTFTVEIGKVERYLSLLLK